MVAFSYLQDRDVFQNYYTRGLARRLLLDAEASREADLQMISRLKIACGAEYTARLQKMMQDIVVSEGLNEDFQRHMQKALLTRDKGMAVPVAWLCFQGFAENQFPANSGLQCTCGQQCILALFWQAGSLPKPSSHAQARGPFQNILQGQI